MEGAGVIVLKTSRAVLGVLDLPRLTFRVVLGFLLILLAGGLMVMVS